MVLACHMISQDHVINGSWDFVGVPLMISHHPAKSGKHSGCCNADMMLAVVEGKDSACPHLDPPLLFISKAYDMPCSHTRNFRT